MKSHVAFGFVVLLGSAMAAAVPEVTQKTSPITVDRSSLSANKPEVTQKTSPIVVDQSSLSASKPEVTLKTSPIVVNPSSLSARKPEVAEKTSLPTGSRSPRAAKEPEVAEKTSPPTGSRSSRAAKEPEVAEKTSPTGSRSPRAAKEPEVAEKTSPPTGSRSSRAAKQPEVAEKTSPTGSPSPLSPKKPEVTERASPRTGSPSQRASKKPEVAEVAAPIEVSEAEEPQQADRTKKSASTTFCVEIRPGPSEAPVKVCENPPPAPSAPAVPHEFHEQHPPPPPTYLHEPEAPVYVVPSYAQPEVFLPNDPCPPQTLPYHQSVSHFPHFFHQHSQRPQIVLPQAPCPPEPCPPTCACAHRPHATISLFRSAMAPIDGAPAQIDGTEMRSNDPETSGLEAEAIDAAMTGREAESENGGTPIARTFLRGHYGLPLYHRGLFGHRYPQLFRYHPHLLPLGLGRAVDGPSGLEENAPLMAFNGQPAMEASQQARYLVHPYANPVGYQSHPIYHTYQSPAVPYSAAHHSIYPGYAVRPQQAIVRPGSAHFYRSDQQRPLPIKSDQQMQQKNQEKSWSQDRQAADQTNRSEQTNRSDRPGPISPSQMLNRMRGSDGSSSFDLRPAMQTFPRINDERIGNDNGLSVNMNFPRGGQPFMIAGPRMTGSEEKKLKSGDCGHDEIGKRDAEKSASEKEN